MVNYFFEWVFCMTLSEALAMRVNELLESRNISQYRLSMLSGVSQSTLSDIRLQRNKAVNIRIILEITQGLNMELTDFFDSPLFRNENLTD